MKKAFTMIELVFVITVIGILAVVAVPKLAPIISDAKMAKARDILSAVRSSLATERQKRILRGVFSPISDLGDDTYAFSNFDGNSSNPVLEYPITNCNTGQHSCWKRTAANGSTAAKFVYYFSDGTDAKYKLDKSRLICDNDANDCKKLLK